MMLSAGSSHRVLSMLGAITTRLKLVIAPLPLAVLILLLAACGGGSQVADTTTPEVNMEPTYTPLPMYTSNPALEVVVKEVSVAVGARWTL
jgi:hypothetical protein